MNAKQAPEVETGRGALLLAFALAAFAANSLLCRAALGSGLADPAGFTFVRMASGALTLALLALPRWRSLRPCADLRMAACLFLYMAGFSFAYVDLDAGTGALLLFGAVQLTMFAAALAAGERLPGLGWAGLVLACAGLVVLLLPGATAPTPLGTVLMIGAGVAWGAYSLLGRGAGDPLSVTAVNFVIGVPPALVLLWVSSESLGMTTGGFALAGASGALASALGYAAWYAVLPSLTAGRAATVQLAVPVIAALGGVALLGEALTPRLALSSLATLGGIAMVLAVRHQPPGAARRRRRFGL
ncbi:MAG: DMT family transporter [Gammaproteobacteria bacterium]